MAEARIKIFVADTGPLITLAAAEALDYLHFPSVPVIIPDAVFYEATRDAGRLGAQDLVDWMKANLQRVDLAATHTFADFQTLQTQNPIPKRVADLGERSAAEVITSQSRLAVGELGILLCEESRILRAVSGPEKDQIVPLSSRDFLDVLEATGRIQSADFVIEQARLRGREPSKATYLPDHDPEIRDAVHAILAQAAPPAR